MMAHQIKPRPSSLERAEREPKYLKWIRTQPCVVCGVWRRNGAQSEAAHTGRRGAGLAVKADDWDAIPLCAWCHRTKPMAYHLIGNEQTWAEHHGIDLARLRGDLLTRYGAAHGITGQRGKTDEA